MMRILHLTKYLPSFNGGIERATQTMADAGRAAGSAVTIIGAGDPRAAEGHPDWVALPIAFHVGPVPVVPDYFRLAKHLDQCDLVHIHLPNPVAELALLWYVKTTSRPVPLEIVPIWHAPIIRWPRLGRIWNLTIQRWLFRASRLVLVASPQLAQMGSASCPRTPFREIPFGIPSSLEEPKFSELLNADPFHIVTIGRLVGYKGFDRLIEALARLPGSWRLTIVGAGPERDALHRLAIHLGVWGRINWVENATEEEKNRLLAECQLFVLPSQTNAECFGLVVGEAFAHGKPVVTTDLPTGLAFLSRSGECGAVLPVGSTGALTRAIQQLRSDAMGRIRAGRGNYAFWQKELSPSVFHERYRLFLREIRRHLPEAPPAGSEASSNATPLAIP